MAPGKVEESGEVVIQGLGTLGFIRWREPQVDEDKAGTVHGDS